ncbi:MAG: ionic transporter y4hA [Flavipsychrobacter sp.]|nr:ionic transporter y4hA [Flavipsychrobacter sp.]
MKLKLPLPLWTIAIPVLAWVCYLASPAGAGTVFTILLSVLLIGAVMSAVHHAEVVAHRVGEPFGTLLLAVSITVIEVSLIVSLMLAGGAGTEFLARDTVFAAVMIILTGIIGICILGGSLRFREQTFTASGVSASLVTLTAISVLTLILPNFTTSALGGAFSTSQMIFVAIISLILYAAFVIAQTGRHRDFFLPKIPKDKQQELAITNPEEIHAAPPANAVAIASLLLLLACLVAVVLIAKALAPTIETGVVSLGAPKSVVGIIIALIILLPEGLAAYRAARNNRLQTSLNLALGSAIASIGLTIPAVAAVTAITGMPISLGIDAKSIVLLTLSFITIILAFSTGRTNFLQGVVLLVLFAIYIFTTIIP